MTTIVQISDTHFGTEVPEVIDAIRLAIQEIAPDLIILSGDITQRARKHQFAAAAEFMASLPGKAKLAIPGNHDIPLFNVLLRFTNPYGYYKQAFGNRHPVWHQGDVSVIGIDATQVLRHTRGRISSSTLLKKIHQARTALPEDGFLVVCAHQPLVTAWPEDADEVLIHAARTAKLLSKHGVDVVLSGHVHVPLITTTRQAFPELSRHFVLSGAGTAISHRTRPGAPNSFNVIRLSKGKNRQMEVVLYIYKGDMSRFVPSGVSHFIYQDSWQLLPPST